MPALDHHGTVICESGAIAEFLCDTYPEVGMGRAIGDVERAEWLNWVHYAETISQHTAALTQQHIALYDDAMRSPIVMQLEAKRLAKCLQVVDAKITGDGALLRSGFSAADVGVGQAVYMAQHFVALDQFPELSKCTRRSQHDLRFWRLCQLAMIGSTQTRFIRHGMRPNSAASPRFMLGLGALPPSPRRLPPGYLKTKERKRWVLNWLTITAPVRELRKQQSRRQKIKRER